MDSREFEETKIDNIDEYAVNERLANSLLRLKFEDRNDIREELHGVRNMALEETPELIHYSLLRMNEELDAIVSASRHHCQHAFEEARFLPRSFVNDREYRMKFLRCELFDPVKAADRMVVHLDYLQLLFGQRALEEPLNTSFFVKEELAALREGALQLLPFRDQSGRQILVGLTKMFSYSAKLRCKLYLYFWHVLTKDVETQRRGIVCIAWGGSDDLFSSLKTTRIPGTPGNSKVLHPSGRKMDDSCPVRVVGIHLCWPDTIFYRFVRSIYVFIMGDEWVQRTVFHHGTRMERQYTLMGYGIPASLIPETDTGVVKLKNFNQWLKVRKLVEKDPIAHSNICECPGVNDVLFRRAGSCMAHPGNSLFKNLIESKKEEHYGSNQTEKRDISWSIVKEIERRNGRFFKWCTSLTCWILITDRSEIRLKVAMSIRDFNRQSKAIENRQSIKSNATVFENQDRNKRKREPLECIPFIPKYFDDRVQV